MKEKKSKIRDIDSDSDSDIKETSIFVKRASNLPRKVKKQYMHFRLTASYFLFS